MSSNFNANGSLSNGVFPHGDHLYFADDAYEGIDGSFANHGGDNSAHDQSWTFPPDRFELAHPDPQNSQTHQHQSWNSNIDPQTTFSSNDASRSQYDGFFSPSLSANTNAYNGAPYEHHNNFERPVSQHTFTNRLPTAYNNASSPYEFQNSAGLQYSQAPGTIAPQALQSNPAVATRLPKTASSRDSTPTPRVGSSNDQHVFKALPGGKPYGNFLVTTVEDLENATSSRRLAPFLHVARAPQDAAITRSALPIFLPRKSRNEIMKLLASDSGLRAKIDKKLSKKLAKQASRPAASVSKQDIAKRRTSESPLDMSSSEDESSDESEEESMQAPIPAKRPSDSALEAVKYDTIKTLWRVPYRSAPAEDIRQAMQGFWEIIQTIRDRWKSDSAAVKKADEEKKVKDLPTLKERVQSQRSLLQASLKAAVAHGHTDILENFGQHLQLMGAMAVFLQDRIKEADYDGALTKAILEFLSRCKSMTKGILERTSINKLLPRVLKRGDESVKSLIKRVNENAASASEKRREESSDVNGNSATKKQAVKPVSTTQQKVQSPPGPAKRAREVEGDGDAKPPAKRIITGTPAVKGSPVASAKSAPAKRPASADSKPAVQPATKKVVAKPSSLFASLQSAKVKPKTLTASGAGDAKPKIQSDAPAKKTPTASGSSSFSFAATMADLTKPKEAEQEVKREESAPVAETPEERQKRLRKEKRKKLRVSWKPEGELYDIRYFTHDPDEELGHDASQVRDVGDLGSEGRMFKQLQHQHDDDDDAMDIDEDESEDDVAEPEKPYVTPSEIDFSEIPDDEREKNYARYGGGKQVVESPERDVQEKREADTLMVIYSRRAEIPYCPKEPPEVTEEFTPPRPFGEPPEEIKSRLAKIAQAPPPVPPSMPDLSALLGSITGTTQPGLQQQQQHQHVQASSLEDIFARFSQPGAPQQQQQTSYASYLTMQNPFNHQQQQQYPYAQQAAAPMFSAPQPAPQQQQGGAPDIAALLAKLQQNGSLPGFTPMPPPPPPPPPPPMGFNPFAGQGQGPGQGQAQAQVQATIPLHDNNGKPKFVVQCKYFKEGKCVKGANCTFRHDPD